jgi:predicted O-methyltransferase YrrM
MANSLQTEPVRDLLDRLFRAAGEDDLRRPEERYIPVSPEGGRLLYALIRAARPATVVEFGTSFGISTIHLAAAVRDNGTGRVVSTELSPAKAAGAAANLAEAGLSGWVTILPGDARQTLATLDAPVAFVLLDGWKDLYLPVLRLLEPRLTPGALILADDTVSLADEMADYLAYVRDPANGYLSIPFPESDGLEITCRP